MGVLMQAPFGLFGQREESFPKDLLEALVAEANLPGVLGNCHASGTDILQRLGDEHLRSGCPIVYTSGDSVFQIAAHEEVVPIDRLYEMCEIARRILNPYSLASEHRFGGAVLLGRVVEDRRRYRADIDHGHVTCWPIEV